MSLISELFMIVERSIVMNVSVCVSICENMSGTISANFAEFFLHVTYSRHSDLLPLQCHEQPNTPCWLLLVASCPRWSQVPRLEKSFRLGVLGGICNAPFPCWGINSGTGRVNCGPRKDVASHTFSFIDISDLSPLSALQQKEHDLLQLFPKTIGLFSSPTRT